MGQLSEPIKLSIFTLLQHLEYGKELKISKLFISFKKNSLFLFPINIRDFKPESVLFCQNQGKNGGKQTKSNFSRKQTKSNFFDKTDKVDTKVQNTFLNSIATE